MMNDEQDARLPASRLALLACYAVAGAVARGARRKYQPSLYGAGIQKLGL